MYERMLDKSAEPSETEMAAFCGENSAGFSLLNRWLSSAFGTEQKIVFPYGSSYGWGVAHRKKGRLICNVFPENGSFSVMLRLSDRQCGELYADAGEYMRRYLDGKYPCGDGGWIHYRVAREEEFSDIKRALTLRCS